GGAVEPHPGRAVGLLQEVAGRQRPRAVEDADVVQAEEAAGEDVPPAGVLAVDPPGEVQQQLLEGPLQKAGAPPPLLPADLVGPPTGVGVDGRVDVGQVVLEGRQLAVFAPAVGAAAGVVVREVAPAVAVGRVVLADGRPLPLGQVRPPPLPVLVEAGVLVQAPRLRFRLPVVIHGCTPGSASQVGQNLKPGWAGSSRLWPTAGPCPSPLLVWVPRGDVPAEEVAHEPSDQIPPLSSAKWPASSRWNSTALRSRL